MIWECHSSQSTTLLDIFVENKLKKKKEKCMDENLYEASEANSWVENLSEAAQEKERKKISVGENLS